MILPSRLVYGFRTNDIEAKREKLSAAFGIELMAFRDDEAGVRYRTSSKDPFPIMTLFPNLDVDEEGKFFKLHDFREFPLILTVLNWEKAPDFMQTIGNIPDFGAELLDKHDEERLDPEGS